jgi:hypothetical protein
LSIWFLDNQDYISEMGIWFFYNYGYHLSYLACFWSRFGAIFKNLLIHQFILHTSNPLALTNVLTIYMHLLAY